MKSLLIAGLFTTSLLIIGCKNEDDHADDHVHDQGTNPVMDLGYQSKINSPNAEAKKMQDHIRLDIAFASTTMQTIHHINVRLYNKEDTTKVVYNKPDVAHVHEKSGAYAYVDSLHITESNGFEGHTDWILEAKVWGHDADTGEVMSKQEFHVHPK